MSIHEELVAKTLMAKPTTDEEWLNIDWDTRIITVPETLTNIGVYNDKDTNRLYFRCPIEYGEFKIADFGIHVNYQNTGVSDTKYDGDVYFVDDVESDGEYLTFSWLVGRRAYLEQGTTAFIVCCKVVDSDNNIVNELNTTLAVLSVLEGLEVDANPEDYPDYLEELLKRVEAVQSTADEAKTIASEAKSEADETFERADHAMEIADNAQTTANEAKDTADGIAGTAQSALDTAQAAETTANEAKATADDASEVANGIAGTANDALEKAEAAVETANDASTVANGIAGTANEALEKASEAVETANTASETAGEAKETADGIADTAQSALDTAQEAKATADEAKAAVPTKVSQLDNDSGYITDSALDGYAKESDVESVRAEIPTKVSELDNDVPYGTQEAVEKAQSTADDVADSAITGITVNGTAATVTDHVANITVTSGIDVVSGTVDINIVYLDLGGTWFITIWDSEYTGLWLVTGKVTSITNNNNVPMGASIINNQIGMSYSGTDRSAYYTALHID